MTGSAPRRRDARRASSDPVAARRRSLDLMFLAVIAGVAVVGLLTGTGGTYAMWADRSQVDMGTVTTGEAALEASWTGHAPTPQDLLPGELETQTLRVTNTGDVPMTLSATSSGASAGLEVRVQEMRDGARPTLEPGQSLEVTVEILATNDLAPGESSDITIHLEGTQIR